MTADRAVEDLLRELAPQVLGALVRRYGHFDTCEDATQEALIAAASQWTAGGVPENPRGWLVTVASRRLIDTVRNEQSRRRREDRIVFGTPPAELLGRPADEKDPADRDDSLTLLFLCCHPDLSPPSQVALTLRACGGLTTAQIAHAFLVPEATMAQRISRAKQRIKQSGATFAMPAEPDRAERLRAVLHVLYLVFNEGYTASTGPALTQTHLSDEAIRLTRWLHAQLPTDGADGAVGGLLALMLLTDARRAARTGPDGSVIPLADQDRSRWNRAYIDEGVALVTRVLSSGPVGSYQLQAAIAAVHVEAENSDATDWPQVLALYDLLERVEPNPVVTLNRAVALAMVRGPRAGLDLLDVLEADQRIAAGHRLPAVRARLLELAGDRSAACAGYREAARRSMSVPEQRYLSAQAARLADQPPE